MIIEKGLTPVSRVDPEAFFKRLGLVSADPRPILHGWREANALWRQERAAAVAAHRERIALALQRADGRRKNAAEKNPPRTGVPRAVWCVELNLHFRTLSEAARFVGRQPGNISKALQDGGLCGRYHWEPFNAARHK